MGSGGRCLLTGFFATLLGGGCSSASKGAVSHPPHHHGAHHGGVHHRFDDAERWAKVFDDPARDAWQRPDQVLRALELSPSMTVADIGAGTGYFTVRLARAVPSGEVLATDVEPAMVRHLAERALREQLGNVRALQVAGSSTGLSPQSVDRVLIVDVWHHLDDRVSYARELAAALRPGGRVLVVDFTLAATHGPPPEARLPPQTIIDELAAAGLAAGLSTVALPEQYIVEARRDR